MKGLDHFEGIINLNSDHLFMAAILKELKGLRQEVQELKAETYRHAESSLNRLYSAREVAEMISPGVHYQTVLKWIREDKLRTTEGNKVSGWELMRFLKENTKYSYHQDQDITGV